jgi:hypothetical protein
MNHQEGEIKMIKDGKEVVGWGKVDLTYHADGNVGIGTPPKVVMGEPVERLRVSMTDGVGSTPGQGAAVQDAQKFYNDVKIEIFEVLLSIMKDETNTARDRMQAAKMVDELTLQITGIQRL